jgi:hypothetical protein
MKFRFRPTLEPKRAKLIQSTLAATTAQMEDKQ